MSCKPRFFYEEICEFLIVEDGEWLPKLAEVDFLELLDVDGYLFTCQEGSASGPYVLFQLRFQVSLLCSSWINESPIGKIDDITNAVVAELTRRCQCDLITDTLITDASLLCFPESSLHITYRAKIHDTIQVSLSELITHLELWLETGATISVRAQLLILEAKCPVIISSVSEAECRSEDSDTPSGFTSVTIALTGAILVMILLGLIVVVVVVVVIRLKRRSAGIILNNSTFIIHSSQATQLNNLQGNSTNLPPVNDEVHEYDSVDEVIQAMAERVGPSAEECSLYECEAYGVHTYKTVEIVDEVGYVEVEDQV